jgi:hypothetical protein
VIDQEPRMPRRADPDYVVDPDRGHSLTSTKMAALLAPETAEGRAQSRAGLRELDSMTEGMPALSRQQKDRERLMPRAATADLGHPRMQRPLPAPAQPRVPFSSRQRKARSKTRVLVQGELPTTQYQAQRRLMTDPQRWQRLNGELSDNAGDLQALAETDQQYLRRVDRSIQAYEQQNGRGHVIYTNVAMPSPINHSNLRAFVTRNFRPGDRIAFDRFTFGTHQLHETSRDAAGDTAGRVAVFEIQTRRGAYLGHSDSRDDTAHLLPRGLHLEVVGAHEATYSAPDGTTGRRVVVQLRDITPEPDRPTSQGGPS